MPNPHLLLAALALALAAVQCAHASPLSSLRAPLPAASRATALVHDSSRRERPDSPALDPPPSHDDRPAQKRPSTAAAPPSDNASPADDSAPAADPPRADQLPPPPPPPPPPPHAKDDSDDARAHNPDPDPATAAAANPHGAELDAPETEPAPDAAQPAGGGEPEEEGEGEGEPAQPAEPEPVAVADPEDNTAPPTDPAEAGKPPRDGSPAAETNAGEVAEPIPKDVGSPLAPRLDRPRIGDGASMLGFAAVAMVVVVGGAVAVSKTSICGRRGAGQEYARVEVTGGTTGEGEEEADGWNDGWEHDDWDVEEAAKA